jgi:hypothetical protein
MRTLALRISLPMRSRITEIPTIKSPRMIATLKITWIMSFRSMAQGRWISEPIPLSVIRPSVRRRLSKHGTSE